MRPPPRRRTPRLVAGLTALCVGGTAAAQESPPPAAPPATPPAADTGRPAPRDTAAGDSATRDSATRDSAGRDSALARAALTPRDTGSGAAPRGGPLARERVLPAPRLPVDAGSPSAAVLHVQVLLDAAGFSPGTIDARWGENTRLALFAFRDALGLDPEVEAVDADTYAELRRRAGARPALTTYVLDAADLRYPYQPVPGTVAEKARARCLCYQTLLERLGERFHVTQPVLRALNPGVDFAAARPGQALTVPNSWRLAPRARVARVVVDKAARGMRGFDAAGGTVFWLPATVGSAAMPSPHGALRVQSVTVGPHYRWDPAVLRDVSRRAPVRMLPPGPNNLVGSVWVALSRPHVGIHGTPDPERVGYAASHGCVRLTNWDALWFSRVARPGMPVVFE